MTALLVGGELDREVRFTFRGFFLPLIAATLLVVALAFMLPQVDYYFRRPGVVAALWLAMVAGAFWRRRSMRAAPPAPEA
jgi:FtsH-binding integral membrane protein